MGKRLSIVRVTISWTKFQVIIFVKKPGIISFKKLNRKYFYVRISACVCNKKISRIRVIIGYLGKIYKSQETLQLRVEVCIVANVYPISIQQAGVGNWCDFNHRIQSWILLMTFQLFWGNCEFNVLPSTIVLIYLVGNCQSRVFSF